MNYKTFIEDVNIGDTIYFILYGVKRRSKIIGLYTINKGSITDYTTKSLDFLLSAKYKTCVSALAPGGEVGVILEKFSISNRLHRDHIISVVKTEKEDIEKLLKKAETMEKKVRIWWHPESKDFIPFSKIDKRWDITSGIPKEKNGGWSFGSPDESWWFRVAGSNFNHYEYEFRAFSGAATPSPVIVAAAFED